MELETTTMSTMQLQSLLKLTLDYFHQEGRSGNFSELFVILLKIFP